MILLVMLYSIVLCCVALYRIATGVLCFRAAGSGLTDPATYAEGLAFVQVTVEEYVLFAWEVLAIGSDEFVRIAAARCIH